MKDTSKMVTVVNNPTENGNKTTNGMTLQLESGDQVNMKLPPVTMREEIQIQARILIIIVVKF